VGRRQRQGRRLEVHGRPAREHRAVHALGLQALQHGRVRRVRGGHRFEYRANANKAKGAPIDLVFPKEGLGWDLEAFAIHKGTKKLDAAKKLADWASSKDAMLLYGKNFAITAQPGVAAPLANVPKDYEARLVKMDFATTAANRERVLAEWTKRYNSKTEKR
jgi:iron(III) transport system substrate-binding protein